ncbi:MAG: hypothetical protein RL154_640 [Pseudomonadota bacterium]
MQKSYLANEPILVKFSMKDYKIEDYGFLGANNNAAMLNVYHAGTLILQIQTDADTTCIDGKCLSSANFMKDFICEKLPNDSLLYIFNAKPIPSLKQMPNGFGFTQRYDECGFEYMVQDRGITAKTSKFLLSLQGIHDAD